MALDIFIWWLAIQALGLVGLPLAGLLFRSLPDGGYAFAKTLGLLLTGYLAWLAAMFGLGGFGPPLLIVSALAVLAIGVWARGGLRAVGGAVEQLRGRWPAVLASEAIFLGAMLFTVWMRAYDPTPWGTERPMDFAFFNAIQRSAAFPPGDPWLAGYSINYYYFGYLLMGVVAQLSGLDPAVAYNLSLALIFALTAQGVAGIIVNLIDLATRTHTPPPSAAIRHLPALLGVIFVLVAGNQSGAVQVLLGDERAVALDGPQLLSAAGQALGGANSVVLPYPAVTPPHDFGELSYWERQDKAADYAFNWWWPSRSLWDEYPGGERRYNITEFPLFSFRLGDMHPHVMALPFGLLAMALALNTLARPAAPAFIQSRGGWVELILTGIALGSLYAINSWDLPTYILLYAGALTLLYLRLAEDGDILWGELGRRLAVVAIAAFMLFAPFHLTFRSLVGGAAPLVDLPIIGRLTSIIAPYVAGRSGLHAFLIIFGLFAVPLVAFVYLAGRRAAGDAAAGSEAGGRGEEGAAASALSLQPSALVPWLPPLLLLIGLLAGFPLLALLGLGLLALERAWRLRERPAESFALLTVALGCAVLFGTELIFIRDVFGSRMNTIFKFYYQVWLLWGTLAPFALWWALARTGGARRAVGLAAAGLSALLLVGALVYPWLTLRDLGRGEAVGLAGRTPREQSDAGRAAISWLRGNAAPGSVVLEMAEISLPDGSRRGGSYNGEGFSGVSAATGLPTVVGWLGHQQQWRGGDPDALAVLEPRRADVDAIYRTLDVEQARALLDQYGVDYVFVGGIERAYYPPESLAKFERLGTPVFAQDEVVIYQLNKPANL